MEKNVTYPRILVLNGPNLNLLGQREPDHYGATTLDAINQTLFDLAQKNQVHVDNFQSNHEGALIDRIQQAQQEGVQFIIINPGGFSHTSVALRDALLAVSIPFIEVHLSNIFKRESFRHHSFFSDIAEGVICGLGASGYILALEAAIKRTRLTE